MSLNITNSHVSNLVQTSTQQTPKRSSFCSRKVTVLAGLGLLFASSIPFIQSVIDARGKIGVERFNLIKNISGFSESSIACKFKGTLSKIEISCPKANYTSEWSPLFPVRETVQFAPSKLSSIVSYEGSLTSDTEGTYFLKYSRTVKVLF